MNRRKFLAIAGGGVILAAGAAVGLRVTRTPQTAFLPWEQAGSLYDEPRRKALSYAILAPNPHNRQPWIVDLSQPDIVVLTADQNQLLPHTDPNNRQITVGLGCFLELMSMAAAREGYRVEMDLFPNGSDSEKLDERVVCEARFVHDPAVLKDQLFDHVLTRRSFKEPFDMSRKVTQSVVDQIAGAAVHGNRAKGSNDAEHVAQLRDLTREALMVEFNTPRTYKESVDLFRIGAPEVDANPDGIDLAGPFVETLALTGGMSRELALDPNSMAFSEGKKMVAEQCETAMAHVWLASPGNSRVDQINAGRDWVRMNLAAASLGIGIHPMSQCLQEFPEMAKWYEAVHHKLAKPQETVQMLARLGYGESIAPSPRWPLEKKIKQG